MTWVAARGRRCSSTQIVPDVGFRALTPTPPIQRRHSTTSCRTPSPAVPPDQAPDAALLRRVRCHTRRDGHFLTTPPRHAHILSLITQHAAEVVPVHQHEAQGMLRVAAPSALPASSTCSFPGEGQPQNTRARVRSVNIANSSERKPDKSEQFLHKRYN